MDLEIAHRNCRQVQLQRLPMIATVERDVCASFRACINQSAARRIFTDDARDSFFGQAGNNLLPSLAFIACAIDVRMRIGRRVGDGVRRLCVRW